MKKNLILASLLLLIGLGIGTYIVQEQERKEWLKEQNDDLKYKLEQTTRQLRRNMELRDSAYRVSDSLLNLVLDSNTKIGRAHV